MNRYMCLMLGMLLSLPFCFAHASPIEFDPPISSQLDAHPSHVSIAVTERIALEASTLQVYDLFGNEVTVGEPYLSSDKEIQVEIDSSHLGVHFVVWNVFSQDDGHVTKGSYSFTVGAHEYDNTAQIIHSTTWVESFLIWLRLVSLSLLVGLCILLLNKNHRLLLQRVFLMCSGAYLVSLFLYLLVKTSQLQGSGSFLHQLFRILQTHTGVALVIQIFVGVILLWSVRKKLQKTHVPYYLALLFLSALCIGAVSHAASAQFAALSVFIQSLHLFAKLILVGIVLVSLILFVNTKQSIKHRNLSTIIHVALFVTLCSGVYIVLLHVKTIQNIFNTSWGGWMILLCMVGLLFVILLLAHMHIKHSILLPTLALLGLILLGVTSIIMLVSPPAAEQAFFTRSLETHGLDFSVMDHPYDDDHILIETGGAYPADYIDVRLSNDDLGIEDIYVVSERRSKTKHVIPTHVFTEGDWEVAVDIRREQFSDITIRFDITYPLPVDRKHVQNTLFLYAITVAGIICILLLIHMLLSTKNQNSYRGGHLSWATGVLISAILLTTLFFVHTTVLTSSFEQLCFDNGDYWHTSVPMRSGTVTSTIPREGCSLGFGDSAYHFVTEDTYRYYLTLVDSYEKHIH